MVRLIVTYIRRDWRGGAGLGVGRFFHRLREVQLHLRAKTKCSQWLRCHVNHGYSCTTQTKTPPLFILYILTCLLTACYGQTTIQPPTIFVQISRTVRVKMRAKETSLPVGHWQIKQSCLHRTLKTLTHTTQTQTKQIHLYWKEASNDRLTLRLKYMSTDDIHLARLQRAQNTVCHVRRHWK